MHKICVLLAIVAIFGTLAVKANDSFGNSDFAMNYEGDDIFPPHLRLGLRFGRRNNNNQKSTMDTLSGFGFGKRLKPFPEAKQFSSAVWLANPYLARRIWPLLK